jgi:uncharacterized protein YndB with AHSA1/START domain
MSKYGIVPEPNTVRFERVLPGPIDRVWQFLTDPEKRARWFAGGPLELRLNGRIELRFDHSNITSEPLPEEYAKMKDGGYVSVGHITQLDAPRLLAYTWWEDQGDNSEIIFELNEQGDSVLLVLIHRRLEDRRELLSVSSGWHLHLDILEDRLNEVEPRPFWSTLDRLKAEYDVRHPA